MKKRNPWFRWHVDFLTDPKMIAIGFENERHYSGICALKCDGTLDEVTDKSMLNYIVAGRLRIGKRWVKIKKTLVDIGLIDENWQPLAWNARQYKSDTADDAAERKRRQREREKLEAQMEDGGCHDDVTFESRPQRQIQIQSKEREAHLAENEAREKPVRSRGSRLSPDWVPTDEDIAFCKQTRPELDVDVVADNFRCYWAAKAGKDATKLDWHLTWRNWVRNEKQRFVPAKPSVLSDYV